MVLEIINLYGAEIIGTLLLMWSGDGSAIHVAEYQPMKLAAAEGLEDGGRRAPFSIVPGVEIPGMLSILATHDIDGYVPGINDIINGYTDNEGNVIPSVEEKMEKGRTALAALEEYRTLKDTDPDAASIARSVLEENVQYMGYGYLESPEDVIPPVDMVYWSFRVMVGFGSFLLVLMFVVLWAERKGKMAQMTWLQWVALLIQSKKHYRICHQGWDW